MTLSDKFEQLVDSLALWFKLKIVRGYPQFGPTKIAPPVVALLFAGMDTQRRGYSLGSSSASASWQVALFGSNERDLLSLSDSFLRWSAKTPGVSGEFELGMMTRHPNQHGIKAEDYALDVTFTIS